MKTYEDIINDLVVKSLFRLNANVIILSYANQSNFRVYPLGKLLPLVLLATRSTLCYFFYIVIILVNIQRWAGTDEVAITVDIVNSPARWPELV